MVGHVSAIQAQLAKVGEDSVLQSQKEKQEEIDELFHEPSGALSSRLGGTKTQRVGSGYHFSIGGNNPLFTRSRSNRPGLK